jgi:selenocysteine lyase/cysteine desulfurase
MEPETLRADIPALDEAVYLNTGASGPSPRRVVAAATAFQERHEYEAPAGDGPYAVAAGELEAARDAAASVLGADADRVALTHSTADGVSRVASALDWEPGDVVVRTDLEHPAGVVPWRLAAERHGVEVRVLETDRGRLELDDVTDAVADARLVCLSSISWNYGTRLRVGEVVDVAHDADAEVLVDAVQSVGQVPVDVTEWGADYVAAASHKWLLGPWGAGMLYVRDPESVTPGQASYASVTELTDDGLALQPTAGRFEVGTRSPAPHAGMREAVETMESVGLETVRSRVETLTDRLEDGLGDRLVSPRSFESGLVAFDADDPEATVERLADQGIRVRTIPDPDAVRASVHVFNTESDVDALLDAL